MTTTLKVSELGKCLRIQHRLETASNERDYEAQPRAETKATSKLQFEVLAFDDVRCRDWSRLVQPLQSGTRGLEVHPEAKLKKMQLRGDFSLASLKRSFCGADALIRCTLRGCSEVENLDLLGDCASLEYLSVRNLANLTQLANSSMKPLSKLRNLEIARCPQLTSLKGIEKFKQIRELEIANCEQLSDASQLSQLEGIWILNFNNCPKLTDCSFVHHLKDKSRISRICFDKTSVPVESLAQLAQELSIEIIVDGRSSKYFTLE